MLSERYEVGLNLEEVYLPSAAAFRNIRLQAKVSEKTLELVYNAKPQGQLIVYGLNATTPFEFVLFADDILIGSNTVLMSALNPDGVLGTSEAWVRIETNAIGMDSSPSKTPAYMRSYSELNSGSQSPSKRFARVRIGITARNTALKGTEPSSPSKVKDSTYCPFLAKLASAGHDDVEAIDTYKRVKDEVLRRLHDADRPHTSQVSVKIEDLPGDYFDIEIPNLDGFNFNKLSPGEGEALKNVITGLTHRLNVLRADHEELGLLREQIEMSSRATGELQDSIQETTEAMQRESMKVAGTFGQLENELAAAKELAASQATELAEIKADTLKAEQEKTELARQILELRARSARAADLQSQLASLKQLHQELEQKGLDTHGSKQSEAMEFAKLTANSSEERRQLISEKGELLKALALKRNEAETLKLDLDSLELEFLAASLLAKEATEAKKDYDSLLSVKTESAEVKAQTLKLLEDFSRREADIARESLDFQNQLEADRQELAETLEYAESDLEDTLKKVNEYKRQLLEQKTQIATLEDLVCVREGSDSLKEELLQQVELHRLIKDEALLELQNLSDYTLAQAQNAKSHVKLLYKFSSAVEERDQEIDQLKHTVVVIKNRNPLYTAVKGDSVDEALAEYLNNRTEAIPVPFYRQDFEVYIFGTKRIFVKLDCGRISIRVGGGFMQLEDFLEIYTKQELEKMENRNVKSANPQARKLLGKVADAHLGDRSMSPHRAAKILSGVIEQSYTTCFGVEEKSPSRSPQRSPQRSPVKRGQIKGAVQISPSTMAGSPNKR